MPYKTEEQLAYNFTSIVSDLLQAPDYNDIFTKSEIRAPGGIPDYIIFRYFHESIHYLIAIEFKLKNWRKALSQAFKYRNFANEAYVVLDKEQATSISTKIDLFRVSNVGLITLDTKDHVEVIHFPTPSIPFSLNFARTVIEEISTPEMPVSNNLPFTRSSRGGFKLAYLRELISQYINTRN